MKQSHFDAKGRRWVEVTAPMRPVHMLFAREDYTSKAIALTAEEVMAYIELYVNRNGWTLAWIGNMPQV